MAAHLEIVYGLTHRHGQVDTLASSHSSFASMPDKLAAVMSGN